MNALASATDAYLFRLEFTDEQRAAVHSEPLVAEDFQRAIDATYFGGFRRGEFDAYAPRREAARVEPLFANAESARANGFRVCVPRERGEYTQDFGIKYFAARAGRQRAVLRRDRALPVESPLYYTLGAYLEDAPPDRVGGGSMTLEEPALEIPVRSGSRGAAGAREAWDDPKAEDMAVVVARSLLEDACDEAARYPEREIGGLILGHLRRDDRAGEVFVEATCLASGEGTTESSQASVTFTADSFAKARRLIELRAGGGAEAEIVVGWYHSHPFRFCAECPLPTPPECLQKVLFYSEDDIQLMESTFYQPFMIGLLVAVEPKIEAALGHLPAKLFGWLSGGEIGPRGFDVVG